MKPKKKICFVVAIPATALSFLKDHIAVLSRYYDVYLAGNIKHKDELDGLNIVDYYSFPISRQISIGNDLLSLKKLISYFKYMKFDVVHSVTPKAGFITALAAKSAGIKHRIHIFTGQVWATKTGLSRIMLKSIDKLIARLDSQILVDGKSQQKFLINERVLKVSNSKVLGHGSISGVNTERFNPSQEIKYTKRKELGIPDNKTVFVFMGRLNRDKGVYELLRAFNELATDDKDVFLLLFGNDEENIASSFSHYTNLNSGNFLYYGATREPQNMLQAGDIFVLPTYREGFGSSVIEAACLGLPTITSDAYGVLDASEIGVTGLQCKVGDATSLYDSMSTLNNDKTLAKQMGEAGRQRVMEKFSSAVVCNHWEVFYHNLLS